MVTESTLPPANANVVIIGAGFAGIEVARALGATNIPAILLDRQNFHLFQPLLYQVATAALSPADIAEPVRKMVRRYASVEVRLAEVIRIDHPARTIMLSTGERLAYRWLVLAAGATHSYFGRDEWMQVAPGVKTIEDARAVRARLLLSFEQAEASRDPDEQRRLTTFAVVGGGPTGVEIAGSIAELARYALAKDFRRIHPGSAKVLLFEAGDRILTSFPEPLAVYAEKQLARLGVEVRTKCPVGGISERWITASGEKIPIGLAIWAAGVEASPLGGTLAVQMDKTGRIKVKPDLSVPGMEGVYIAGDLALVRDRKGRALPGLAQVAKQQGIYLGRALVRKIKTGVDSAPFVFKNRGNTAIIGRHSAIFDFGWCRVRGWPAWLLWAVIHVYLLVGFQHRLLVVVQWVWRYLTYERGARLILEPPCQSHADGT
ncbi:MAG TPA: NAD(P)/FAD-dependent oxidoreductase [Rhizomicrobium sp.]|jgi:NADH dehydrogenase|nr:NAD(P)/FAD-dependent oxidoreductase [Rhizomicrobium sp.]